MRLSHTVILQSDELSQNYKGISNNARNFCWEIRGGLSKLLVASHWALVRTGKWDLEPRRAPCESAAAPHLQELVLKPALMWRSRCQGWLLGFVLGLETHFEMGILKKIQFGEKAFLNFGFGKQDVLIWFTCFGFLALLLEFKAAFNLPSFLKVYTYQVLHQCQST